MTDCRSCKFYKASACNRYPTTVLKHPGDFCGEWRSRESLDDYDVFMDIRDYLSWFYQREQMK